MKRNLFELESKNGRQLVLPFRFFLFRFLSWRGLVSVSMRSRILTGSSPSGPALVTSRLAELRTLLVSVAIAAGLASQAVFSPLAISKFGQLIVRALSQPLAADFDKFIFNEPEASALPRYTRPRRASGAFKMASRPQISRRGKVNQMS